MKISFYAPFKPLHHRLPSGDQVIARGLFRYLKEKGHHLEVASNLRARWIFWKPWLFPRTRFERRRIERNLRRATSDLWLTYLSYYKGPDILAPGLIRQFGIPYVIFQGAYATKYRKNWRTRRGFFLNRRALLAADHVFVNKKVDHKNLLRLLPPEKITYVKPGITPEEFGFDRHHRRDLRNEMGIEEAPVILTAAMFRPGVKTEGLSWVIRACGALLQRGRPFHLVIIGDGNKRRELEELAGRQVPGRVHFVGRVPRPQMQRYYSAGDVFAFPGIGESLGMVYLEAQSCGLPVVAFETAGVPEVVRKDVTGLLVPPSDMPAYIAALDLLLTQADTRRGMGRAAAAYIRNEHDLNRNYVKVEETLLRIAAPSEEAGRNGNYG